MEKIGQKEKRYGLIGKNISYSFSRGYFSEKFSGLGLTDHSYENFDLSDISEFEALISNNKLMGLNVTIPYKEQVIPHLYSLDAKAEKIGAVNTIKFTEEGPIGFNTDAYGFQKSLEPHLKKQHAKALILGTGGASKAVAFVLDELGIDFTFVSRTPKSERLTYNRLNEKIIQEYKIIINCSPLGTHPKIDEKPNIPYQHITPEHILFDLIYNPPKTAFLNEGENRGATIQNGLPMLQFQAEKAWEIWNP